MKKILNIFVLVLFIITSFISFSPISFAENSVFGTTGSQPSGLVIDPDGNIYTANQGSNNVTKITPLGVSSTLGSTGNMPSGIVIDPDGNIYTANQNSNNVTKITPLGVSSTLGSTGSGPKDLVIDSLGNIFTTNQGSNTITKITPAGESSIFATIGNTPTFLDIDTDDNLYVSYYYDGSITKITPGGVSSTLGTVLWNQSPFDLVVGEDGNIYLPVPNGVGVMFPGGEFYFLGYFYNGISHGIIFDSNGDMYTAVAGGQNIVMKITGDSLLTSTIVISAKYDIDQTELIIGGIIEGTSKSEVLSFLSKNNPAQVWDDTDISDPVLTDDTLVVTAEDGETSVTYTIGALLSTDATISSEAYTITIDGDEGTITEVPSGTSLDDFLGNLTMGNENQYFDYDDIGSVNDPVEDGDILVVWAEDEETYITYTITTYLVADLYWYNSGIDANWNTLAGNWWTDINHTVQAGALPTWEDSVGTLGTVGPIVDIDIWEVPESLDATATGVTFSSVEIGFLNELNFNFTGDATFNGTVKYNGTLVGNAVFNDTSQNTSFQTVDGNAIFNDSSQNNGEVSGYACFRDESENNGTVGDLLCPPTVVTSLATEVIQTSSTLNGEVTDKGCQGDCSSLSERGFEYGLTTDYGDSVGEEGGYVEEAYMLGVSELTCGTTYHFRAYAVNDFDTSYGEDVTFTTSACDVPEEEPGNTTSSGSSRKVTLPKQNTEVTCPIGHKYNTITGQLCTNFTSSTTTPTPTTTCTITLTLRQGMRNEQVKCLQSKLNITSDGIFGPMTKGAVMNFQKLHNLVVDGIVGPLTRGKLQ